MKILNGGNITKIVFNIIIFNSDFVLKEVLTSVYPFANQILVSEGPVTYWQQQGYKTSSDKTNEILANFPDPENKITVVHGQFAEKHEQANATMKHLRPDNDYIWNLDADEIFKPVDLAKIIQLLETGKYTSAGFKSCTFYGGFEDKLTGFEENVEFLRVHKIYPGSTWLSHRPPQVKHIIPNPWPKKHLDMVILATMDIRMYHYSYVFPRQVFEKVQYYKAAVSQNSCIDDYFQRVYWKWINGDVSQKKSIEYEFKGVHEFKPEVRGPCKTEKFTGKHPQVIIDNMSVLKGEFNDQVKYYKEYLK